jgi:transglutaminase-like putative cysteine protease
MNGAARGFTRALWIQALSGGAALALSASTPEALSGVLAVGAVAGLVMGLLGKRLSRRAESTIAIASCAFVPIDLAVLNSELAPALARFLLILQLAKLLGPRERRDEGTILVVALIHVAVAASATVEPIFAPIVLCYAVSAVYALSLRELRGVLGVAAPREAPVTASFRVLIGSVSLVALLLATAIFFAVPRVGAKLLPIPHAATDRVSGYSDTIALEEAGRIRESASRAFRVEVVKRGNLGDNPYWRGQALDSYDGSNWKASPWARRIGHEFGLERGAFDLQLGEPPANATIVDIYLEPMPRTQTLFTPGIAHSIEYKTPSPPLVNRDAFGSVLGMWFHARPDAYRLVCVPSDVYPEEYHDIWNRPSHTPPSEVKRLCLALPEKKLDRKRLAAYANGVLDQARIGRLASPRIKAQALANHLRATCRYTLDARRTQGYERVTDFLFNTKEGHCEVFAGALAVLLRTIDVPARVVNGFKGGDFHPWSGTITVKDRDAHAWVEVLDPAEGWILFDPTPPDDNRASTGILDDVNVWFEILWFKNVIAFDTPDQVAAMKSLKERFGPWGDSLREILSGKSNLLANTDRSRLRLAVYLLGVGLVLGTALATIGPRRILLFLAGLWRRLREQVSDPVGAAAARELEEVLLALARAGIVRRKSETAEELASRAVSVLGDAARGFEAIVPLYYRARYGGRALGPAELQEIREAARRLAARTVSAPSLPG